MTTRYQLPPQDVVDILDAPPTPVVRVSPTGTHLARLEYDNLPGIGVLAQPMLGLAGLRINPERNEHRRSIYFTGIVLEPLEGEAEARRVELPEGCRIARMMWSPDGGTIAWTRSTDVGSELWVVDVATAEARQLLGPRVNDTMGYPIQWDSGSTHLLLRLIPEGRGESPPAPRVPQGPVVEETVGRAATNRTYQDLLEDAHSEALFEHHMTSQIARLDIASGALEMIGEPGIFREVTPSPGGDHLLIKKIQRPYPYTVPYQRFAHSVEIWSREGTHLHTLADLPVADEVPTMGVPTGPRGVSWVDLEDATLTWSEALDGGDPLREVEHREQILRHAAPFDGEPTELLRLAERFVDLTWLSRPGEAFITEYDRDRRWITTAHITLEEGALASRRVLFDRSYHDRYADPGNPVLEGRPNGVHVVDVDDEGYIYLVGDGATPEGDRPFLDRYHLESGETERLFRAAEGRYERFLDFVAGPDRRFVIRRESASEPPSFHLIDGEEEHLLYATPHPHPELSAIEKELVTYERADGVSLSGTLYLPPDREEGERLPLVLWAYPMEYNDAATAGQIRSAPTRFTRLGGSSPLFFITQGYAVLDRAAMPVIGDPETMNDTFVEQIVTSAQAAIDVLDGRGLIDPDRVGVAGHSYGAFMVANLLARCDLFKAGIARSGAYNRSLTPFGFQGERRNLWEARDTYIELSPFFHAQAIERPLLMIHGELDPNSGTFPLQSKRLFRALQGLGGTARLVLLPHEGHGYRARESILHVLAESFAWFDTWVKDAKDASEDED